MTGKYYPDKLLVNRYKLIELVGSGAMGQVYRAEDKAFKGLNVAIKILSRSLDDFKMIERFQREANISALLSEGSINIVKVKDYGVDENQVPFYVMELLEGENLADFIQFHDIPLLKFLNLARQICLAMDTAHNGILFEGEICPIIHRDIKPSNIFIMEDEVQGELVKILDFGIAKLVQTEEEEAESFVGTLKYCSPEQIQGKELDNRSDIYSLGVVFYEILEKRSPWNIEKNTITSWSKAHIETMPIGFTDESKIPKELQTLIMSCLAKSPLERPQSIGEIIQVLDSVKRKLKPQSFPQYNGNRRISSDPLVALEKIYLDSSWPKNKPQQKIVFPRITTYQKNNFPSLWTMLEGDDVNYRQSSINYHKFVFQSYPHPMILWITLLYSPEYGPRWLPCYLDLKTKVGIEVTKALSNNQKYHVLLFALNKPERCQDIVSIRIMLSQRTLLKKWTSVSEVLSFKDKNQVALSKRKLKHDFEKLKPEIILQVQKSQTRHDRK